MSNNGSGGEVAVRLKHCGKVTMEGWQADGPGRYSHSSGRAVVKTSRGWEVVGASLDGYAWTTMHNAMHEATSDLTLNS